MNFANKGNVIKTQFVSLAIITVAADETGKKKKTDFVFSRSGARFINRWNVLKC